MSWFMAGSAAVTALSAAKSGAEAGQAASRVSIAQNEAIIKTNIANTIRTGYRVGLLNMQQGLLKRQAQQRNADTISQAKQVLGAVSANAAASGTVGASVDAVVNDVNMKLGEAQAQQAESWEISVTNFNTKLAELVQQGKDSINDAFKADIPSDSKVTSNALFAGAVSFASSYFASKMKLGLGPKPPEATTTPAGTSNLGGEDMSYTSPTTDINNKLGINYSQQDMFKSGLFTLR